MCTKNVDTLFSSFFLFCLAAVDWSMDSSPLIYLLLIYHLTNDTIDFSISLLLLFIIGIGIFLKENENKAECWSCCKGRALFSWVWQGCTEWIVSMLPAFNHRHLSFCIPEQLHNSNIDLNSSPLFLTLTAKSIKNACLLNLSWHAV